MLGIMFKMSKISGVWNTLLSSRITLKKSHFTLVCLLCWTLHKIAFLAVSLIDLQTLTKASLYIFISAAKVFFNTLVHPNKVYCFKLLFETISTGDYVRGGVRSLLTLHFNFCMLIEAGSREGITKSISLTKQTIRVDLYSKGWYFAARQICQRYVYRGGTSTRSSEQTPMKYL